MFRPTDIVQVKENILLLIQELLLKANKIYNSIKTRNNVIKTVFDVSASAVSFFFSFPFFFVQHGPAGIKNIRVPVPNTNISIQNNKESQES